MKKLLSIIAIVLCFILTFALVACNKSNGTVPPIDTDDDRPTYDGTKTLVVYFSQPDNVDDSTVDIDGEMLGNTQYMAYVIQENTGANIFRIIPEKPYPTKHNELVDLASKEKAQSARPKFVGGIENFSEYDNVFVGYPNWWGDMPMIMYTFFDAYDFTGKTIIPFNTHGGSGFSSTISTIRRLESNATVMDGKSISRDRIQDAEQEIIDWVKSLGLEKTETPEQPGTPSEETASLTYQKNGNAYTVTGVGNDKVIVIPAEYEGLPVTTIGESAFAYSRHNDDIISVTIPDTVTTIERNAFYNRDELVTVNIGANSKLQTIGNNAFSGNHSLKSIYIPASVTMIGDSAFNNCGGLDTITVAMGNTVYSSEGNALIEKATNTLIRGTNNTQIPDSVTTIAPSAFRRAATMTTLVIPTTVMVIGNYFIADSAIKVINYGGTEDEWNAIQKSASMWNYGNRDVEVVFKTESRILIVYFTAEIGNTERIANYIHSQVGGDIVKIEAADPYTSQDLNYSISNNRPEVEKAENARPEIAQSTYNAIDMSKYDTIFIGYSIWWWTAPMIVGTFLEHYDLTGFDIYPFSQSASMNTTQFNTSMEFVRESAAKKGTPNVHDGLFTKSNSVIDTYLSNNGFAA